MIDGEKEDLASLYVLDLLDPEAARRFEAALLSDAELREFTDSLRETAAALALAAPSREPPASLKYQILGAIRESGAVAAERPARHRVWLAWGLAAGLAVTCSLLAFDRARLVREVAELRDANELSEMKIATLSSLSKEAPAAAGVVVWDKEAQKGFLKLDKMPPLQPGKDYQLWVVDPKYKQPVNGGVFGVDPSGTARVSFRPDQPVNSADKFAISVERKGGVSKAEGPIVMLGQ